MYEMLAFKGFSEERRIRNGEDAVGKVWGMLRVREGGVRRTLAKARRRNLMMRSENEGQRNAATGERKPKRKGLEREGGVRRKALAKARRRKEMVGSENEGQRTLAMGERWLWENASRREKSWREMEA